MTGLAWLVSSRKTLLGLITIVMSTLVAVVGLWLKADKDTVLTLVKVVGGMGFVTVGGVAAEDAATKLVLPATTNIVGSTMPPPPMAPKE